MERYRRAGVGARWTWVRQREDIRGVCRSTRARTVKPRLCLSGSCREPSAPDHPLPNEPVGVVLVLKVRRSSQVGGDPVPFSGLAQATTGRGIVNQRTEPPSSSGENGWIGLRSIVIDSVTVADLAGACLKLCRKEYSVLRSSLQEQPTLDYYDKWESYLIASFAPELPIAILGLMPREFVGDEERTKLLGAIEDAIGERLQPVVVARLFAQAIAEVGPRVFDDCYSGTGELHITPDTVFPTGRYDPTLFIQDPVNSKSSSLTSVLDEVEGLRLASSSFLYYNVVLDYSAQESLRPVSEKLRRIERGAHERLDLTAPALAGCPRAAEQDCVCANRVDDLRVGIGHPNVNIGELLSPSHARFEDGKYFWIGPLGTDRESTLLPDASPPGAAPVTPERQQQLLLGLVGLANEEQVDVLMFPEYSTTPELSQVLGSAVTESLKVIVAGSYHQETKDRKRSNISDIYALGLSEPHHSSKVIPFVLWNAYTEDISSAEVILRIFAFEYGRAAVVICRDLLDRHLVNVMAELGTRFILVPSATPKVSPFVGAVAWLATQAQAFVIVGNGPLEWPRRSRTQQNSAAAGTLGARSDGSGGDWQYPALVVLGHPVEARLATRFPKKPRPAEQRVPGLTIYHPAAGCLRFIPLESKMSPIGERVHVAFETAPT